MKTKLNQLPKVKLSKIYKEVLDVRSSNVIQGIYQAIKECSWPSDEKELVIKAIGLRRIGSKRIGQYIFKLIPVVAWVIVTLLLLQTILEIYTASGPITSILLGLDTQLQSLSPKTYDILKVFFGYAGSFVKSPAEFDHPLLLNALAATSAIILVGAGFKSIVEKFDIGQLKPRSIIQKEQMIKKGIWPIDEIGHILTFGATDASITEPLMSTLKKHGFVIPVHRGPTNTYPNANIKKLWVCAGFDKTPETTRNMANRELLLQANCLDASVILVNCVREISLYRPLNVSNTEQAPHGILFPQTADAILEQVAELTELLNGKEATQKIFIAIVSRPTIIGRHLLNNKPIRAKSLFEEERDVPTAIVEPEELVEKRLAYLINKLKKKYGLFKGQLRCYLLVSGDAATDEETKNNMAKSFLTCGIVNKMVGNPRVANIVIITSTEDQNTAALVEQYRQELDAIKKKSVPIIVIQKRPDRRALPKLGHIYTIAIQDLISQEVDKILSRTLMKEKVVSRVVKKAGSKMRIRQKRRISAISKV